MSSRPRATAPHRPRLNGHGGRARSGDHGGRVRERLADIPVADPVGRGPHFRRCRHGKLNVSRPEGEPYDPACRAGHHRRGGRRKGSRGACFGRRTGLEPARPPFSRLPSHDTAAIACRRQLDGSASTHGSAVHLRSRADGARAPPPRHGLCTLRVRVLPSPLVVPPRPSLSLSRSLPETGSPGWAPRRQPMCTR